LFIAPLSPTACVKRKAAARAVCAVSNRFPTCHVSNNVVLKISKGSQWMGASRIGFKSPRLADRNENLSNYTTVSQIHLDGQYLLVLRDSYNCSGLKEGIIILLFQKIQPVILF
jgi:hypothetical protein